MTNPENETTTYTYDLLHRRLTATDPLNQTTEWTYDAEGNKLTEELADATVTAFEYDAMNRLTKIIDALNAETEMTYGGGDLLVSLEDARNNVYSYEYDLCNLRTKMIYPGGSYEQWTYDGAHNLVTYRTRAGQVMTCTFDNRNRDILCDWSDSTPDVSRTYDAVGRVLTIDNIHSELTYTYDAAGQLLSEEQKILAPNLTKTVAYSYNADGLRSKITYPDGKEFTYDYTGRNQLHEINFNYLTNPLVRYTYDLAGRRTKRELNNSTETNYSYDAGGRVTLLEHENSVASVDRREYGYNAVNNRTWEKRLGGLGDAYGYDATQQVTGVQYDATDPDGTPSSPTRTAGFAYDAVGNRTTMVDSGTTNYSTNALNQYTSISTFLDVDYDSSGNLSYLLTSSGDRQFFYDASNRLEGSAGGTVDVEFVYDGRNRNVGRSFNGATTYYAFDGWNIIEEYDATGTHIAATAHGEGTDEYVFRWSAGYILCYYHQDALGNVTTLTDMTGAVVEEVNYDVFGKPSITDSYGFPRAVSFYGNRFLFTGREYLAEIELYDYRNRYYSPLLGRFLQVDPIRFEAGDGNMYRYVGNNALNLTDPLGLCSDGDFQFDGFQNVQPQILGGKDGITPGLSEAGIGAASAAGSLAGVAQGYAGGKVPGMGTALGADAATDPTSSAQDVANRMHEKNKKEDSILQNEGGDIWYHTGHVSYSCCCKGQWKKQPLYYFQTTTSSRLSMYKVLASRMQTAISEAKTLCGGK